MSPKKASGKEPWMVRSLGDVARFFGVHPDTVKGWRRVGMPGKTAAWDLAEIVAWRNGKVKSESKAESAQAALARVRAQREQFLLEREQGGWVEVDPVCRLLTRTVNESKVLIDQLPDQILAVLPPDLSAAQQKDLRRRMQRVIDDVYRALAEIPESEEITGRQGDEE